MTASPERIAKLRHDLLETPDLAEALNELWWSEVAARVSELPPDQRTQAEDHLGALIELLRGDRFE